MNIFRRRQALAAAQIEEEIPNDAPIGAINGKFTINANGDQVYFSQGNLQYIGSASTPYWQFADKQWDYLGNNGQGSDSPNVDRDLFGWGTSGYNHGAVCYQPWSIRTYPDDYYAYGQASDNLSDKTGQADWGYNAISNGGNQIGQWRTLTMTELYHIMAIRNTLSGIRYARARVNGVNGMVLLPDDWSISYYNLGNTNSDADYSSNTISSSTWTNSLESHGAVFLPAAGYRYGTAFYFIGDYGEYWTPYSENNKKAYVFQFSPKAATSMMKYYGNSVRLAQDIQQASK